MFKKLVAAFVLVISSTSLVAYEDDYSFRVDSLVGFEGGYSSFDVEKSGQSSSGIIKYKVGEAGIKIGAQTKNYRVFLSIRNHFAEGYDYVLTYGGEFQYMFNFSKMANFFIGINGGMVNARFSVDDEANSREFADPYYGGDLGFNLHLNETFDLELGAKVMSSKAQSVQNNTTYDLDNIVTGYSSIIIKYQMD